MRQRSNDAYANFKEWDNFETQFFLTLNEDQHNLLDLASQWAEAKRLQATGQINPTQVDYPNLGPTLINGQSFTHELSKKQERVQRKIAKNGTEVDGPATFR